MSKKMTKKQKHDKDFAERGAIEIGRFHNIHGEEFLLWKYPEVSTIFVTGDEFDWEGGYVFFPDFSLIARPFLASTDELREVINIARAYRKAQEVKK